jgi:hypothetical protein
MKRLGLALLATGAAVWAAGAVAWISGVWVTLPPDTVRLLVLSLAGVTGGLLVGAGALVGRSARQQDSQSSDLARAPHEVPRLREPIIPSAPGARAESVAESVP